MAKPDMGTKRQCQVCSTKFFDMNKSKIVCPKCGAAFQASAPPPSTRASRAAPVDADKEVESEPDTVSLEDAEATGDPVAATEDVEVEDDDAPADTFLEEEEEDGDDVAGLIDGDMETDEEP